MTCVVNQPLVIYSTHFNLFEMSYCRTYFIAFPDKQKNVILQPTNVQDLKVNIIDHNALQRIKIDRQEFWADSVATFKDPKFNLKASPRVVFLGEGGIDAGRLQCEYATLLCQEIFSPNAFLLKELMKTNFLSFPSMQCSPDYFSLQEK